MSISSRMKVAVVGGGVLGVSTAQQLARSGVDVVLITEGELASSASGRSLSWLNSAGLRREPYHRLRMAGIDRYRTLSAQHPDLDWLHFAGGLVWHAADQADELHRHHEYELAHGYDSRLLARDQIAAATPGVDPTVIPSAGVLWHPGEGWVDLPNLIRFLVDDFVGHGGQLVTHAGRCRILTEGGAVTGVRGERGSGYAVDAVVLATGAAVPGMLAELGLSVPDATPISLLVTTKPVQHQLTAVLNGPRASVRPTAGGALAVDSDWTTRHLSRAADGSYLVPASVVDELLAEASMLLTGNPSLAADRCGIGPKPIPGDGEPVLGRVDEVAGLYVAFTHSGATLALIAGELLAYEVVRGVAHPMLTEFNARRFASAERATS